MKRLFFTALILMLYTASYAQMKNYQVSAIAFYNFENLFDAEDDPRNRGDDEYLPEGAYHYTQEIYNQKLHNLAAVIQQLGTEFTPDGPAIIGTAEIENDKVLQDLTEQPEIRDRRYQFVHFDGPDSRGIDVALLYHPDYFRVLHAQGLKVDISTSSQKDGRTRDILFVQGLLAGDTVYAFVNHWPSRRGSEAATAPLRAIAAATAKRVIDSILNRNAQARIILMGDLNDDPVDASVARVLGAKGEKATIKHTDLYNPWLKHYKQGDGTLAYNNSWNLFDQIILSGIYLQPQVGWQFYKAAVFRRDFLLGRFGEDKGAPHRSFNGNTWINGYSDHLPVIIYLIRENSNR